MVKEKLNVNFSIKKSLGAWQEFKHQHGRRKQTRAPFDHHHRSFSNMEKKIKELQQSRKNSRMNFNPNTEPFNDLVQVKQIGASSAEVSPGKS